MYIFANYKNKWRKKRILIVIFSKKIMNNKIITLVLMGFLVFSCKKNQQIESINNIKKLSQNIKEYAEGEEKSTLELAIVKKISDKEILVVFDNKIENSEQNINLIRQTLLHLVGKIIWSSEENKKMFNDGVSFNIQVRDSKTKNIIITEVVNKTSINNNIIIKYNYDISKIDNNCLKLSKHKDDKDNNFYQYKDIDSLKDNKFEYIYLLDIPTSKEYLDKIINLKPKKVFLICEEKQVLSDVYLIDKNRLIKLFNLILSTNNKQINVAQQLDKLLVVLKTNVDSLKIMIQIFKELELINFVNNTIILNPDYKTVDLKKSSSFIRMENIFEVENLLLKESIANINKLLEV